jgi:hypothetical protein
MRRARSLLSAASSLSLSLSLSPAGRSPSRYSLQGRGSDEERCGVVVRGGVWAGGDDAALQSLSTVPLMCALCAHNDTGNKSTMVWCGVVWCGVVASGIDRSGRRRRGATRARQLAIDPAARQ